MALRSLALLCVLAVAEGGAFRGGDVVMGKMRVEHVRAVMEELNSSRASEQRVRSIEDVLRPTFVAMDKNERGNLEPAAVRYVLHRLFVQRHGMYVKGLEAAGASWTAAPEVLDDRVPSMVQAFFEEKLQGHGLGLHELAVLAVTLEHLIHEESMDRLRTAYEAMGLPLDGRASGRSVQEVLDTYMALFILGRNASLTPESVLKQRETIGQVYPGWAQTRKFSQQVLHSVEGAKADKADFASGRLTFAAVAEVVEEIGERYGRWQDAECQDLKGALMSLEHKGTGRVLLKDFYSNTQKGSWQFSETAEYLRELGALEESPERSVIIPNYVNAKSNCLASSGMFSVCCINECEALMGFLEAEIAAPEAEPERLLDLVAGLASATVAPRNISAELASRLREVASHHGGRVPLHGRLFAQWLHHAYPRECPFPHKGGTTNPMTPDQWMQQKGKDARVSKAELTQHASSESASEVSMPWHPEEELVVARKRSWLRSAFGWAVGLAACVSALLALARSAASGARALSHDHVLPFAKQHVC